MPGLGLVMVGGYAIEGGCDLCVTATTDGKTFQALAPLPSETGSYAGCVSKINGGAMLYSGSEDSPRATFLYDVNDDAWTQMSDLSRPRVYHSCGSFDALVSQKTSFIIHLVSFNLIIGWLGKPTSHSRGV